MTSTILIYVASVALVCGASAVMLRLQPIGAEPGLVNRFAGLTIGRGFRLTRRWNLTGDRQLVAATFAAWLMWTVIGGAAIAIVSQGYAPQRLYLVYGLMCSAVGAVVGFAIAFFASDAYARRTNMSTFEGARGYFVCLMGLLGGIVGMLGAGIPMTIYFFQSGRAMM
jgi:hypothetical protein